MKKLLSLALALVMILSLSVPAFAADITPSGNNGDHTVTGKYQAGAESSTIYSVDINWGSMAFTYTAASKGTWNAESLTYVGAKDAAWSWTTGDNEITVTNHSNAGITVTPAWTADSAYAAVNMTFGNAPLTLSTADNGENGAAGEATKGTITVTPSGDLPAGTSGKIGQITLSIAGTNSSAGGDIPSTDKATITGFYTTVGGTKYTSGTVTVSDSNDWSITFTGTNLNSVTDENKYGFDYNGQFLSSTFNTAIWNTNEAGTEITCSDDLAELISLFTSEREFIFSNDGGNTWKNSGVKIVYDANPSGGGETTDYTTVSTLDGLTAALASGGNIKLANDITMTEAASISNTITLDLNNCTLNVAVNGLLVSSGASLRVENGTIVNSSGNAVWNDGGIVSVENCTLTGDVNVFYHSSGTSSLKNCTVNGKITHSGSGTITLSGNITFGSGTDYATYKGIAMTSRSTGSVICHFDPTGNIYQGAVTDNSDGTWTVTAAS